MAQWAGQFTGLTHETKVQDAEESLRKAVQTHAQSPTPDKATQAIQQLAERVLKTRLKALHARIAALSEPGKHRASPETLEHLRQQETQLLDGGVAPILKEFGIPSAMRDS